MRLSEKILPTAPYVFILFHYYCFLKVPITRIIKPTIPIHKETKEILEEHISNNIANNNIVYLAAFLSPPMRNN